MKRSSLTEFEIEEEGLKLRICRNVEGKGNGAQSAPPYPPALPAYAQQPVENASTTTEKPAEEEEIGIVVINFLEIKILTLGVVIHFQQVFWYVVCSQ